MSLAEFKGIFWLEFIHRLWGRAIGVVFVVPLVWFAATGAIDRRLGWRLGGLFVLGGLQGLMGWIMVKSGLIDQPAVSQYRLAAHLVLAVVIYVALLWTALDVWHRARGETVGGRVWRPGAWFLGLALVTLTSGAFVAGLDAGLTYNTFPLMDGRLVPRGLWTQDPWFVNLFENVTTVQFQHRLLAVVTVLAGWALWRTGARAEIGPTGRVAAAVVGGWTTVQFGLGIATLLLAVPVWLGVLHQAGALVLVTLTVWLLYEARTPPS